MRTVPRHGRKIASTSRIRMQSQGREVVGIVGDENIKE
jgi:hypothetical protein